MFFHILITLFATVLTQTYEPTWESIDSRPLPDWYDNSKFGIFMHWGVYCVPGYRSEWFWWHWQGENDPNCTEYMAKNYAPGYTYAQFANDFRAEFFDADAFREIVEASGAKYFVFTSKHHEGYTMWPSKVSWNWNSVDIGPKIDVIDALKKAFAKTDIHFGLYFSLYEWFNPQYMQDTQKNTTDYVDQISYPQLLDIVNTYQPEVVWSDGDWDMTAEYWKSKEFIAWLYNESPVKDTVVVNDRWGRGVMGVHGGYLTYEDNYIAGTLLARKWENCDSLDQYSWGGRRTMRSGDVLSVHDAIAELAQTIACNGNFLLNVGPDMHGKIPPLLEERLRQIGDFVKANAEAVYGTHPWAYQSDLNNVWYTSNLRNDNLPKQRVWNPQDQQNTIIYAWLIDVNLTEYTLQNVKVVDQTKVTILSTGTELSKSKGSNGELIVNLDKVPWEKLVRIDVLVLKIEYAQSDSHDPLASPTPTSALGEESKKPRDFKSLRQKDVEILSHSLK
ncbi:unnamed protein product, partial [Mesorhabditis belari]|uniref:Putative alpha-L-fucosidase n=1 Tax=Mesorhabditis belari TaxID=2138241 RepID=A0AAF3F3B3_9BILA